MWRVQVKTTNDTIIITRAAPIDEPQMQTMTKDNTFNWDWGIRQELQGNLAQIEEAIKTGAAKAVSDGPFQESNGSAAWTIEGKDNHHCLLGSGWTPGAPDNQSTYHSKLFGLWGIFHTLKRFIQDCNITMGHVHIAYDGLLALQQAQSTRLSDPAAQHYDLIGAIWVVQ